MRKWVALWALSWLGGGAEPLALQGALVHPGGGQPAVQRCLVIDQGRITSLADRPPTGSKVVDVSGLHLYPGIFDADSVLGLQEIDSVRGGIDVAEVGVNNADLRAEVAFNPDSDLLPVARSAGILAVALQPTGGRFCGQIGLLSLAGWTREDMLLGPSPGVVVQWPRWSGGEESKARHQWRKQLAEVEDALEEARHWDDLPSTRPVRPDLEALVAVMQGKAKLFVRAQSRFQIESALELLGRLKVKWVLVGGAEADECAPALAAAGVDVIYTETYRVPARDYEDADRYYRVPSRLAAAGVRVALGGPSSHDNARWIPEMAARAWAHGWTQQAAEDAITWVPAQIFGLTDVGRLAPGQRAQVLACSGPLLDGQTRVVRAWAQGQELDLQDRQKRLFEKYRNKPRLNSTPKARNNGTMISPNLPPASPARPRPSAAVSPTPETEAREVYEPGVPAWGHSLTGNVRYHEVASDILGNRRQVWVYLPPGYEQNPEQHYPVVYAMDGQNVFEKGTAYGGREWQMDEAAERAMRQGSMQKAIIVAVSNAGDGRLSEYSHVADPKRGGGKAPQFAAFLKTELKPMIDGAYRTRPEAESTGVLGSSMGGLVSLYLGLAHSNTFGLIGALSPSLWWAEKDMIRQWQEHPPAQPPQRLWLDMGTRESQNDANQNGVPDVLDNTRALHQVLADQGQPGLMYHEIPGAGHNEFSWSQRIQQVLEGMLPPDA